MFAKLVLNAIVFIASTSVIYAGENPCPPETEGVFQIKAVRNLSADGSNRVMECQVTLRNYSWWQTSSAWSERETPFWFYCGTPFYDLKRFDVVKGALSFAYKVSQCDNILGCRYECIASFSSPEKISTNDAVL